MLDWTEDPTRHIAHRPWPLPRSPWIMGQRWSNLLFAHWPVSPDVLRPLVPPRLALDLFEGTGGWVSVTPFYLSRLRPWGFPAAPWISEFPELNVRTYVTLEDKPGVYFFSLDAGSQLAVYAARSLFHLAYYEAAMTLHEARDGTIFYHSRRTHAGAAAADFSARYRPTGSGAPAAPGTLDHWLVERYCLYAVEHETSVYRAEIHHRPWLLQPADARIELNTMGTAAGIPLEGPPSRVTFSSRLDVVVWAPEPARRFS
jgi:uncharacterized protein YqjF (DUF2071 family)